jgi:hypothetical protein
MSRVVLLLNDILDEKPVIHLFQLDHNSVYWNSTNVCGAYISLTLCCAYERDMAMDSPGLEIL